MPNFVDFYVDVPEYRGYGFVLTASTVPPSIVVSQNFKRVKFTVDLPDDVFKVADVNIAGIIETEEDDSIPF